MLEIGWEGRRKGKGKEEGKKKDFKQRLHHIHHPQSKPNGVCFQKTLSVAKIHTRAEEDPRFLTHRLRENICVRARKNTKPAFRCNGNLLVEVIDIPLPPPPPVLYGGRTPLSADF